MTRFLDIAASCFRVTGVAAGRSQPVKNPGPCMTRCKENSDLCHDKEVTIIAGARGDSNRSVIAYRCSLLG